MAPRIPLPKCGPPVAIQDVHPYLQQQVCAASRPGHLLLLAEALADHLIDRRFHKARAHPLSSPVALAIVRDETLVVLDAVLGMGAAGTSVAFEAAHIALMRDDWTLVPEVIPIARRTMRVVWLNIAFTTVYNLAGLVSAALGVLPLIFAAAAQPLPDLGILASSSRLLWQTKPPLAMRSSRMAEAEREADKLRLRYGIAMLPGEGV